MSIKLMAEVWELALTPPQQQVLLALAWHADDETHNCYPSVAYLIWRSGLSERTVRRTLRELEKAGVIAAAKHRKGGRGHATEYHIDPVMGARKAPFVDLKGATVAPIDQIKGARKAAFTAERGPNLHLKGATVAPQRSEKSQDIYKHPPAPQDMSIKPRTHPHVPARARGGEAPLVAPAAAPAAIPVSSTQPAVHVALRKACCELLDRALKAAEERAVRKVFDGLEAHLTPEMIDTAAEITDTHVPDGGARLPYMFKVLSRMALDGERSNGHGLGTGGTPGTGTGTPGGQNGAYGGYRRGGAPGAPGSQAPGGRWLSREGFADEVARRAAARADADKRDGVP